MIHQSYHRSLLERTGPLADHERADLRRWLETLEADCAIFGETPEDTLLMGRILEKLDEDAS